MPVKVKCSGCQAVINAPDRVRGKTVKCPKCSKPIRVPAGDAAPRRKPAGVSSYDDDDFLSALDVNRLEDRSARVCPKCGTIVGQEDVDCPMCGADLATGGLGTVQRARVGRKGAAPSEYYNNALKDATNYLFNRQHGLVWKSVMIFAIFSFMAVFSGLMVVWCHQWPTKLFWWFIGLVCQLVSPGWVWYTQLELTKRALSPKMEKDRIVFEPFAAVSLGIKSYAWVLVFGLPIWMLFGLPAAMMVLLGSPAVGAILLLIGAALFLPIAFVSWPVAQANFAMPVTFPGWMLHKVLQDVGRNIGPILLWAVIALFTAIPVAGAAVASNLFITFRGLPELQSTFTHNSRINGAIDITQTAEEEGDEVNPELKTIAGQEKKDIDWVLFAWIAGGMILAAIPQSYYVVFNGRTTAYLIKLFRANMFNLIEHTPEYEYRSLSATEKEELERQKGPLTANAVTSMSLLAVVFSALGGLGLAMFGSEVLGYFGGFGLALMAAGGLLGVVPGILILKKAFDTSLGWGLAMLIPLANSILFFVFIAKEWRRTQYEFQLWMVSIGLTSVGGVLFLIGAVLAARAAAEKQQQAALISDVVCQFLI